jgi:hypothetical protein
MSTASIPVNDLRLPVASREWIDRLPDGAVSVEAEDGHSVLRASQPLQSRFEELLESRKTGPLAPNEQAEYEAICDLDQLLSGFNRLARRIQQG